MLGDHVGHRNTRGGGCERTSVGRGSDIAGMGRTEDP